MIKKLELEAANRGEGCLGKSQDDEPVFVLVARDRLAANAVRLWAHQFRNINVDAGTFTAARLAKYDEGQQHTRHISHRGSE
jgi:hypothetical protein